MEENNDFVTPVATIESTPVEQPVTQINNEVNNEQVPKKKSIKTIIIVLLIVVILGLVGFIVYDKFFNTKEEPKKEDDKVQEPVQEEKPEGTPTENETGLQEDDEEKADSSEVTFVLEERTNLKGLCGSNSECNRYLGIVGLRGVGVPLTLNIKNNGTKNLSGEIIFGEDTKLDIKDATEDNTYPNIEYFEAYEGYFIIYMSAKKEGTPYYDYLISMYDVNLRIVGTVYGTTCHGFEDFKFENDKLRYYDMTSETEDNIFEENKNTNGYSNLEGLFENPINSILKGNYSNSKLISYNYECGFQDAE